MQKPNFLTNETPFELENSAEYGEVLAGFHQMIDEFFAQFSGAARKIDDGEFIVFDTQFSQDTEENPTLPRLQISRKSRDGDSLSFEFRDPPKFNKEDKIVTRETYRFSESNTRFSRENEPKSLLFHYDRTITRNFHNTLYDTFSVVRQVSLNQLRELRTFLFDEIGPKLATQIAEEKPSNENRNEERIRQVRENPDDLTDLKIPADFNSYLQKIVALISPKELENLVKTSRENQKDAANFLHRLAETVLRFDFPPRAISALNAYRRDFSLPENNYAPGRLIWEDIDLTNKDGEPLSQLQLLALDARGLVREIFANIN